MEGCWIADMVEEAVEPAENAGATCDRVFVIPETGSDLVLGQMFLDDFFFEDHSILEFCPVSEFGELVGTVEVDELEFNDEEEFDLWMFFRGIKTRDTSSVSIEDSPPCPPLPELYHPKRGPDSTLGGDATAVMEMDTGYCLVKQC